MQKIEHLDWEAFMKVSANMNETQEVFKLQQLLVKHPRRSEMTQWADKACLADQSFMDLYTRKYMPPFPTPEELENCPEGSLGKALGKHLKDNKIALDFAGLDTSIFYKQDMHHTGYLAIRATRNHDVFHVVLNLGTTPLDECRLFNVQLAQFASVYHAVLLASGYLHTVFFEPENLAEFLSSNSRYYQIGKRAKFLPGFPFEDHWRTNLNEVRSMLNIDLREIGVG